MLWDGWRVLKLVYNCVIQNIASSPDFMYIVTRSRFKGMPTPYLCCDIIVLLLGDLLRNNDYSWSTPSMACLWDITLSSFCKPPFSIYPLTFISNWLCCFEYYIGQSSPLYFRNKSWCLYFTTYCMSVLWSCKSWNMLHL